MTSNVYIHTPSMGNPQACEKEFHRITEDLKEWQHLRVAYLVEVIDSKELAVNNGLLAFGYDYQSVIKDQYPFLLIATTFPGDIPVDVDEAQKEIHVNDEARKRISEELDQYQLLIDACIDQDLTRVQQLLADGISPNARVDENITPLHLAAKLKNEELVQILVNAGADPCALTHSGKRPFHYATDAIQKIMGDENACKSKILVASHGTVVLNYLL